MKNLKLIVLTTIAVLFLRVGNLVAQESSSKTVIIRAVEFTMGNNSGYTVTNPEGNTSSVTLERGFDLNGNNAALIKKEIEKWKLEGYEITHLSVSGENIFHTTIILEK